MSAYADVRFGCLLREKYKKMIIPFFMGFIIINLGTN